MNDNDKAGHSNGDDFDRNIDDINDGYNAGRLRW
jgi:hypothetical protein